MILDVEEPCDRAATHSQSGQKGAGKGHLKGFLCQVSSAAIQPPTLLGLSLSGPSHRQHGSPMLVAADIRSSVISALRCSKSLRSMTGGMPGIAEMATMANLCWKSCMTRDFVIHNIHFFSSQPMKFLSPA